MKDKTFKTEVLISKKAKDNKTYYNLHIIIDDMKVAVSPKFLNPKQQCLLKHKLARMVGDENVK